MKYQTAIIRMLTAALTLVMAAIVSLPVGGQTPPQDPPQPSIVIPTTDVTAAVIVTDRYGRFITGLQRENFAVREDGTPQKIERFDSTEAPFNVALLIDTSRSTQNKLSAIRKAAQTFIKQLQPNDRVMIVTFDERVTFVSDFTNNRAELERAIKSVKSSYSTSLYDAIYLTITEKMSRIPGRKAIVVLTDGVDTSSKRATFESALDLIATTGIISYAIQYETRNDGGKIMKPIFLPNGGASSFISNFSGSAATWPAQDPAPSRQEQEKESPPPFINIPRPTASVLNPGAPSGAAPSTRVNSQPQRPLRDPYLVATDFLRSLAVQSGALYLRAENIENTSYAFQQIASELRNQYTLTYVSTNDQRDGGYRAIAINVRPTELVVRTRRGYRVPKGEAPETETAGKPTQATKP